METVLVTGFGPFGDHKVNASWQAVKLLPSFKIDGVNLVIKEIPVSYVDVDTIIPKLWNELKPKLVIHVGVSAETHKVVIESQGHRTGYVRSDCYSKKPPNTKFSCAAEGEDCIKTTINIEQICKDVNCTVKNSVGVSTNAGRYLCEYIYYTSLKKDSSKTIFVHVPCLNKPYSADELATILHKIIISALNVCS